MKITNEWGSKKRHFDWQKSIVYRLSDKKVTLQIASKMLTLTQLFNANQWEKGFRSTDGQAYVQSAKKFNLG